MTVWTYLGSAGLGLLLVTVGMILGFANTDLDHDGDADLDSHDVGEGDTGAGAGLSLLSMTGLGSLLVGFGAVGYATSSVGGPTLLAVPVGLAGAWGCFYLTALIKRLLVRSLNTGRSAGEQDLVYQPATVTIPVPGNSSGRGQVLVRLGDRTFYVPVKCALPRELAVGEQVVITAVSEGVFLVETRD